MKKSIFAKLLILVLCLSLILCGCGIDTTVDDDDPTDAPTTQATDPTSGTNDPADPENPEDPEDPENPGDGSSSLGSILENIFGDSIGGDELESAIESGKITITVGDMISNVMYVDLMNLKLVDELTLNIEGQELNAQLYLNEHDLVVALPQVLPENYGISFDSLAEDLPNSAIWTMMGISYEDFMARLSESLDEILEAMNSIDTAFPNMEECLEDLTIALEECLEKVESSSSEGQVVIYGETVDALIYSYTINNESMEEMVYIMLDWFADNTDTFSTILSESGMTGADIVAGMDDMKASVADFFDNSDLTATLNQNFNADTAALMSIDASFEGTVEGVEGGVYMDLTLGVDPAESNLYSFRLYDYDGDGITVSFGYETVSTTTTYTLTASNIVAGDAVDAMVLSLSYDTASYAYKVTLAVDGESSSVNGICKVTEDVFEFTIDTLDTNGEVIELDLRLVAQAISSSEIPDAPAYKNLLQMSEIELSSLLLLLENAFG